ncbi:hypothetical protein AXI59_14690 [Bacillus nakamurai]|uniref:Uncharacterized protein n=1 Tax=Bacillus nakamurai TaxID=1793963 RepID=A0A150F4L5_9BACI|nr:UPF0715 family protein [Bacillus nakamurai]KXZ17054.1 hypothetical protein AXI58_01260 [Bacillus nakamurai]KXZ20668.1 hypothetical protein AXI59_14690 [Bacillus nakamurai]MCC9022635.1 UPF0715 family protein [Bacillus nakamurai]MCP6680921.1 UPF0715 family protein [Bacillus nakamurai]MED1229003.1 UPF0715 family protein [Bacillus nakamurai]
MKYNYTVLLSAATMSVIYSILYVHQFVIAALITMAFYFLFPYLIFALPLQYYMNKKPKRFHPLYFIYYLAASFIANCIIFGILQPSGESLFSNSAFYIFAVLTAVVYWVWDSVLLQKQRPATEA